jgi:hypothetical protein
MFPLNLVFHIIFLPKTIVRSISLLNECTVVCTFYI